jgi:Transposase IS116/IS110/IS902 family
MNWPIEKTNSFKILVREFYDRQWERTSLDNRLGVKKDGEVKKKVPPRDDIYIGTLLRRREELIGLEAGLAKVIAKEIHKHPLWKNFLKDVKGCGETMAAVIISEIDIAKAPTVSNIWSFAGLAPGKDRKVKGEKCPFNQFLRAKLCGVLGSGFLKASSPYRAYYDDMKHRLESKNWGTESKNPTDKGRPKAGHQHKAATRYMVKMFIKDLYVAWRTIEKLPVREPYQEEYLGKKHHEAA